MKNPSASWSLGYGIGMGDGGMAGWRDGGMAGWRDGGMVGVIGSSGRDCARSTHPLDVIKASILHPSASSGQERASLSLSLRLCKRPQGD
jgi:hypothetical protein